MTIPAGEPFALVFALLSTSTLFQAGNRIRIAITFKNLFSAILNWLYLDPTISEAMSFKKRLILRRWKRSKTKPWSTCLKTRG
jgi:hypothetical protein